MASPVLRRSWLWILVCGGIAGPAQAADEPWIRVVEATDTGMLLELRAPEPVQTEQGWAVPGFDAGGAPGLPVTYQRTTWFAVPGAHGAQLQVEDAVRRELGRLDWPRQLGPVPVDLRRAATAAGKAAEEWQPVAPRDFAGLMPAEFVALGAPSRLRGVDVVPITFHPVQVGADGAVVAIPTVRVRVRFADRARLRPATITAAPVDPLHDALLNAASVARWEPVRAAAAARRAPHVQALPAQRLRLRIAARGLYELTYTDLRNAGVPVDQLDPRTFRLYFDRWKPQALVADSTGSWQPTYELRESALWVPGETDGSFTSTDPNDKIWFYALGPEGYEIDAGPAADPLAWFRHPYDRAQVAWLVWNGEFGRRMTTVSGAPTGTDSLVTAVTQRTHFEQDTEFDAVDDLWIWQEVRDTRPVRINFPLDLGGAAAVAGSVRVSIGYGEIVFGPRHDVDVRINGALLGRLGFDSFSAGARPTRATYSGVVLQADNNLDLSVPAGAARITELLDFDVVFERPLVAVGTSLEWADPAAAVVAGPGGQVPVPGDAGDVNPRTAAASLAYRISGFTAAPQILDVGDPANPQFVTGATDAGGGSWTVRNTGSTTHRGRYIAMSAAHRPARLAANALALRTVAALRTNRTSAPDLLIVTHSSLRAAADRLAAHRRAHYPGGGSPDVAVVDVQDIYDNFSGGQVDPIAIRNYAKFLYGLDATPKLQYLVLFGDGNRDVRQLRAASAATLVPPVIGGYYGVRRGGPAANYGVDDWFAELDTPPPGTDPYPLPDLAVGRLTARTLPEAERFVDKIIGFETSSDFTPWRTRILMVADDECHPLNGCNEGIHTGNTESLCGLIPPELDTVKFYLTEYVGNLGQKPAARAAFIRTWNEGCSVINYQGHGAPRQLADEVLFLSTDVPSLTNGARLPLFLPISCTVGEFDDPDRQSMCEDLLALTTGGAIANIGATTPTFINSNLSYNIAIFNELWPRDLQGRRLPTTRTPLGLVEQRAKIRATNSNVETYVLIGDPALTLPMPKYIAEFTGGVDSLQTGHRALVTGRVVDDSGAPVAGYTGIADVVITGTADDSGYRSLTNPSFRLNYDLLGVPFYRGNVPVANGQFAFQFIVPVGARAGVKGRASIYLAGPAGDAKGARNGVRVSAVPPSEGSVGAPRIALRFPNDRTRVKAGTVLTAELRDENGINIQGTSLRNSIYLDFDGRNEPLNVTAQFRYAAGSDSVGALDVPLPSDLEAGPHQATLIASDNLQNTATSSIDFEVVEEGIVRLVNVLAFPNPFRDWTQFFFEITDPAEVEVRVFTTSGRQVWQDRQRFTGGIRASIQWDGVDQKQDRIANGTYLYRVTARPDRAGTAALEYTGKVVIMR